VRIQRTAVRPASRANWGIAALLAIFLLAASSSERPFPSAPLPTPLPKQNNVPDPGHLDRDISGDAIQFQHLSLKDGLSQNSVYCILQDHQGFFWFGTQDGLNRYDGYEFTVYRPQAGDASSLSHHFIRALYEDEQARLWIGTDGGGLNRLDLRTGAMVRYEHDSADPHSLSGDQVFALYGDRVGRLWIGTENGLDRFDPATASFVHFQHGPDPSSLAPGPIRAIHQDRTGILWIGSGGGGLDRFDPGTETFTHYRHDATEPNSLSNNAVLALSENREGGLWVGTDGGGLDLLDPSTGRFRQYRHDPGDAHSLSSDSVGVLYEDRAGTLWAGTLGGGLNRFDRESGQFIRYRADLSDPGSLSHDFVSAIFEDRSGSLWVGTLGGGINQAGCAPAVFRLYRSSPEAELATGGPSGNVIWSIWEGRDGVLWIGTFGGGLNRFDRQNGEWTQYRHDPSDPASLSHDVVRAVRQDRQGMLWVGTEGGGLDRLDPATGQFSHYRHDPQDPSSLSYDGILTLYPDQEDGLWVGTWNGLNHFDPATGGFARFLHDPADPGSLSHNTVRAIYQDRAGTLWVGTPEGLNRFDRETEKFTRYIANPQNSDSLSSDDILSIYEGRAGTLWVGTFGGGLNGLDPETGSFVHYDVRDGLPSSIVYAILEEEGGPGSPPGPLWLSTNGGLSRFDLATETFTNYGVRDGLQSNEFNAGAYFQSESGEMFFGGVNGFNAFYPDKVEPNPYIPPLVLTGLKQGGQQAAPGTPVEGLRQVTFRWPNNYFEFEFAALSYCQPERNQYAYRLEGFDREWVDAGTQRSGRYTNLPGGTYTLRIKGSNSDGAWNEEGLALRITVVPPFWATWWFRGLAILLPVVGLLGGFRLRVRAIEKRSRELEGQVTQRTAQLREEMEQRLELGRALQQSQAEKAVVEERNRLARDLHDSVTQSLYAVTLYADAAARLLSSGQAEPAGTNLHKLRRTAREALGEMRLLIFELRPPILEQEGLAAALQARLEAVEGRAGVKTGFHVEGEGRLPPPVEEGLYRIAVEALNNALKHARASCISVSLHLEPDATRLEVADDGSGFDVDTALRSGGIGLPGMVERAEQMGGELTVNTGPGEGTQVRVVVHHRIEEEPR
jgi:signal transduction histidine kinase/ligand-binding sensor domain-containing protein